MQLNLTALPAPIAHAVETYWRRFIGAADWPDHLLNTLSELQLPRVWGASNYIAESCIRDPELLKTLRDGDLQRAGTGGDVAARVTAALATVTDESSLKRALRQVRRREIIRIAWRDLADWAELGETLRELSELAEACLQTALGYLHQWHRERYGEARSASGEAQSLVVLGLGKLGARELNFSSDIDLIFAFPESGESDGRRVLDNRQYFTRLGQRLITALDEVSADGFVFRVDMRLRPFGESSPLVASFSAMEIYYQNHGREWERYALIKARPVAGDIEAGEHLLESLRPFVYRRYLDFNALDAVREMKRRIDHEVERRELHENIKLGRGGIREIEFIGQAFELIRGGRDVQLRERAILKVLDTLARQDNLQIEDVETLKAAYTFLRRVENHLQEYNDRQTHTLPSQALERLGLALSMEFADWSSFLVQLQMHRDQVRAVFDQVFVSPEENAEQIQADTALATVWQNLDEQDAGCDILRANNFGDADEILRLLRSLRYGNTYRALGERGRQRLDELMPRVLEAAARSGAAATTLTRLLRILGAIAGRTTYLTLLAESPQVLKHLTRLVRASDWLSEQVAEAPLLLDELLDPRIFERPPDKSALAQELDERLTIAGRDLEAQMDVLRQFQQASVVQVAAADLSGKLALMRVSDHLTAIAELVVQRVFKIAWAHLASRYGAPMSGHAGDSAPAAFCVIAYGKLGGIELGYGSDLDLIFIHDGGQGACTNGERALDNDVFFARLGQRIINFLSTVTTAGVLYRVDTRLRPSGSAGLLVTSLNAFKRYQHHQAWTWEHQALLRARPVAGDAGLGEAFSEVRREILCQPRSTAELKRSINEMRQRMRREKSSSRRGEFSIKHDRGGLLDLEFLVQYWALRWAQDDPRVVSRTDNMRILDALIAGGRLSRDDGLFLQRAYRGYRARLHRLNLAGHPGVITTNRAWRLRRGISAIWTSVIDED